MHKDVFVHFFEVGNHKGKAGGDFYSAHKFIAVSLHNFQYPTLHSPSLPFDRKYHYSDLVAIQGLLEVRFLHQNISSFHCIRVVGNDKGKTWVDEINSTADVFWVLCRGKIVAGASGNLPISNELKKYGLYPILV